MKILTILGARPQFIKAACLNRAFKHYPNITETIAHTAQHHDKNLNTIFFEELHLTPPAYQLPPPIGGNRLQTIARMQNALETILRTHQPDATLVYGDTNSTLAGALVSHQLNIPIIHIEAGLRSYNFDMPEEKNRITTDKLATLLFCPTELAKNNLLNEGLTESKCHIIVSGDIMKDNARYYAPYAKKPPIPIKQNFVLATLHRAQNTDDLKRLHVILEALETIGGKTQVIFPMHPRTAGKFRNDGPGDGFENASEFENTDGFENKKLQKSHYKHITFAPPLSYLQTLWLLQHAQAVLTDSGGLQKEAYFFNKPCLILREESEYEELIKAGCAVLMGADKEKIIETFGNMRDLFHPPFPPHLYSPPEPYVGDSGNLIAKKILEIL
ncbi:UDP-N-acetylglucosamine 2-epimerase [Helicobacter sp. 11S02596-1]|nr:UDP-N-acetylglucosamine 2-epimerase [Helicobacter sp. 11S02596-1]